VEPEDLLLAVENTDYYQYYCKILFLGRTY